MKKTFVITIALTYENVTNYEELKEAVLSEAHSWVESGAFGPDLSCSVGNGDLAAESVSIKTVSK